MKTLNKSLTVLDLFLDGHGELSLDEVARLSKINKSTARRIILSFISYGFLRHVYKRGKYSLGMKFLDFSQALKKTTAILEITEPYLYQLERSVDETVSLALWDESRAVICQSVHPNHPLKVTAYDGTMVDMHQSSLGKAIMACLPEDKLDSLITNGLKRFTPNTITDVDELKRHLTIIRRDGVAVDDEEGFIGVRGIAATIKNEKDAVIGAITIIGPTVRLTREKSKEVAPLVKDCALKISQALGYKGS